MATPDKTSETLNLAEAMTQDTSSASCTKEEGKSRQSNFFSEEKKSTKDDENANLFANVRSDQMAQRLNDIDMSFREKVVTKESSSDFIMDEEDNESGIPSPFRESYSPRTCENETELELVLSEDEDGLIPIKTDNDKDWKPKTGKVYHRVLKLQKTQPKKYSPNEFIKKEESDLTHEQVKPEPIPCPKCGRKLSPGALDRHIQFCT